MGCPAASPALRRGQENKVDAPALSCACRHRANRAWDKQLLRLSSGGGGVANTPTAHFTPDLHRSRANIPFHIARREI